MERDNALMELAEEKAKLKRLEEEKKMEVDGLKEETTSQLKAWEKKEKSWEKRMAEESKRNKEEIDSLGMGREQESENWSKQVEGLELEKETKEAFRAKSKNILERMKKEREGWEKEREILKKEKEGEKAEKAKMVEEKKELEEKRVEEEKVWEKASERMQKRITELEEDKKKLEEKAAEWQREGEDAEATRRIAEEKENRERKSCEEEAETKTKEILSKLEDEALNGRELIEDLQSDKRRDCQLLLELRAQLVRPTYAASRSYTNPLRYSGSTPPAMREPTITAPALDSTTLPEIPRVKLPPSPPSAPTPFLPRPTVRLPPLPSSQLNFPPKGQDHRRQMRPRGPKVLGCLNNKSKHIL